jgi:hypothetical protein
MDCLLGIVFLSCANGLFLLFFFFLVTLRLQLRASHLLGRQVLNQLSHSLKSSSPVPTKLEQRQQKGHSVLTLWIARECIYIIYRSK